MKTKKILSAILFILLAVFMVQCEKQNGRPDGVGPGDDATDRPDWAGGGDAINPSKNPSPGISKGGDFGDLYVLLRTEDGVPVMIEIPVEEEMIWVVQPVDDEGVPIGYTTEGELEDPTDAIPVDFGRLNTVRQPASKLEMAFIEAMKVLKQDAVAGRTIEDIHLDFCGRLVGEYTDDGGVTTVFKTIDAPRENMAIYKEIMQNLFEGRLAFLKSHIELDPLTIAASCFAAGSDKTGTVNVDEMIYINTFLDCAGLVPLSNEHEYGTDGLLREYFNFTSVGFVYDRSVYEDRWIQCLIDEDGVYCPVDEETGLSTGPTYSVWEIFELGVNPIVGGASFTGKWDQTTTIAELYAIAIDDAVQVLDYVHGNSNFRFTEEDGTPLYVNE